MNKTQLVEAMALDANLSKVDTRKAVDAFVRTALNTLREGERITIPGFGSFYVQQTTARMGRNPRTGAAVKIPARRVIKFRSAAEIE